MYTDNLFNLPCAHTYSSDCVNLSHDYYVFSGLTTRKPPVYKALSSSAASVVYKVQGEGVGQAGRQVGSRYLSQGVLLCVTGPFSPSGAPATIIDTFERTCAAGSGTQGGHGLPRF